MCVRFGKLEVGKLEAESTSWELGGEVLELPASIIQLG